MRPIAQVQAHLRRRLLINYRLDPEYAGTLLPQTLRPQLVDGSAVAGVCLVGLERVSPISNRLGGIRSENAAHRIAVEWDELGETAQGVFIFERHSSSLHSVLLGGRAFPGVHRRARFTTLDTAERHRVSMRSRDQHLDVDVQLSDEWSSTLFPSLQAASDFTRAGRVGWSRGHDRTTLEPVALTTSEWSMRGGEVRELRSTFFDSMPAGVATLDGALVMRNLPLAMSAVC
jgi:hypothetical protein